MMYNVFSRTTTTPVVSSQNNQPIWRNAPPVATTIPFYSVKPHLFLNGHANPVVTYQNYLVASPTSSPSSIQSISHSFPSQGNFIVSPPVISTGDKAPNGSDGSSVNLKNNSVSPLITSGKNSSHTSQS
jgi:hypothetical protein